MTKVLSVCENWFGHEDGHEVGCDHGQDIYDGFFMVTDNEHIYGIWLNACCWNPITSSFIWGLSNACLLEPYSNCLLHQAD